MTLTWEQRKLGEVGKTQSGVGFPNQEQGGTNGIPFFKVSDMNNPGNEFEMKSSNNYVTKKQIDARKWKPITEVPAVIFAKVGAALLLNRKRLVNTQFLIDNNTMAYEFSDRWEPYFGKTLFDTLNLPKYAQTGALPSFNGSDIETIKVMLPSKKEQVIIGTIFKKLNTILALQQRKLELLNTLKKGFLQNILVNNRQTCPKLRFRPFRDKWNTIKFGNLFIKNTSRNIGNKFSYKQTLSAATMNINEKGNGASIESLSHYKVLNVGDIAFEGHTSNKFSFGRFVMNDNSAGIMSPRFASIKPKNPINITFWKYYINYEPVMKYVLARSTKAGTMMNELVYADFFKQSIRVPSNDEQTSIGLLLESVSVQISNQRSNVYQLASLKKSLLQKMII